MQDESKALLMHKYMRQNHSSVSVPDQDTPVCRACPIFESAGNSSPPGKICIRIYFSGMLDFTIQAMLMTVQLQFAIGMTDLFLN